MLYLYSWILNHIKNSSYLSPKDVFNKIGFHIAEIDSIQEIHFNSKQFTAVEILEKNELNVIVKSHELHKTISLPLREDSIESASYIVFYDEYHDEWQWLNAKHVGGLRDFLFPAVSLSKEELEGDWKKKIPEKDYILTIANTTIAVRSDLLSHRGLARDVAALFNLELVPDDEFLINLPFQLNQSKQIKRDPEVSSFFGCTNSIAVENKYSDLVIAWKLAQVDIKSKNLLIDLSNYVLMDYGHPIHIWDTKNEEPVYIKIKNGYNKEILLVDNNEYMLSENDICIETNTGIISLAGIMGSHKHQVSEITDSISIISEVLNKENIKKTSKRLNLKTQSVIYFEKYTNFISAKNSILRMIKLLQNYQVIPKSAVESINIDISADPSLEENRLISVFHKNILNFIGIEDMPEEYIQDIFQKLGYKTSIIERELGLSYEVEVPAFKNIDDIYNEISLIKEIARFYGYDNILPKAPAIKVIKKNFGQIELENALKEGIVENLGAQETSSYGLINEEWINHIPYQKNSSLELILGHSSNHKELRSEITINLLHILKNLLNSKEHSTLSGIFELGHTWKYKAKIHEQLNCAIALIVNKKEDYNFYYFKHIVESLLSKTIAENIEWAEKDNTVPLYMSSYASILKVNNKPIGFAGFVDPLILINNQIPCGLFVIEFTYNELTKKSIKYIPPKPFVDISFLINVAEYAENILTLFYTEGYTDLQIIDWFIKDSWKDKKSLTLRVFYNINDQENNIYDKLKTFLVKHKYEVR